MSIGQILKKSDGDLFVKWAEGRGYVQEVPADNEGIRLRHVRGGPPLIFFERKMWPNHYSVPDGRASELVNDWNERPKP